MLKISELSSTDADHSFLCLRANTEPDRDSSSDGGCRSFADIRASTPWTCVCVLRSTVTGSITEFTESLLAVTGSGTG